MMRVLLCLAFGLAVGWPAIAQTDDCGVARSYEEWHSNPELEACAARGVPAAQAQLAMMYWGESESHPPDPVAMGFSKGISVDEMRTEGRRLMEAAAQAGNALAQNELGRALLDGRYGAEADPEAAFAWLRRGVEGGDDIAPYNLARMYFSGIGVQRSVPDAVASLRLSAERRYKPARCSLARWLDQFSDEASRGEARALRAAVARDRLVCGPEDIMSDMPVIDTSNTL